MKSRAELLGRYWSFVILAGLAILSLLGRVWAENPPKIPPTRCDWTDCSGPSGSLPAESKSNLAVCTETDRASCREQCRLEFGDAFHTCVNQCLSGKCSLSVPESSRHSADDGAWCVEIESQDCVEECKGQSGSAALRCRRACLESRCPNAERADTSNESVAPGAVECQRCRRQHEYDCARLCRSGSVYADKYSGLSSFACEKACLLGRCGSSCAFGF